MAGEIVWDLAERTDSRMGAYAVSRLYVGRRDGKRVASVKGSKSGVSRLYWTAFVETEGSCPLDEGGSEGFDKLADAKAWVSRRIREIDLTPTKGISSK